MNSSICLVGFQDEDELSVWLRENNISYTMSSFIIKSSLVVINIQNYKSNKKDFIENKNIVFYSEQKKFRENWYNKLRPSKIFSKKSEIKDYILSLKSGGIVGLYRGESEWVSLLFGTSDLFSWLSVFRELKKWSPNLQSVGLVGTQKKNLFLINRKNSILSCINLKELFFKSESHQQGHISTKLGRAVGPIKLVEMGGIYLLLEGALSDIEFSEIKAVLFKYEKIISHKSKILIDQYFFKKESLLWQTVFETVEEPVALLQGDRVISSNKKYKDYISSENKNKYKPKKYLIDKETCFVRYESVDASRRLHQKALQQEKMAALGSVAGQIAHALNNPLTGILSMSQVLQRKYKAVKTINEDLCEIEKAAVRCNKIVQNLRSYSNESSREEFVEVDAVTVLKDTMSFVKVEVGKYKYKVSLPDEAFVVKVNPQLLQQVFFNLIINATHAVGLDGYIEIGLYKKENNIVFYVKDNGSGMSPEIQEKIFEAFFTTKIKDKGTGLGLSLVQDIVKSFHGKITVTSKEGVGSVFEVYLPEYKLERAKAL